MRLREEYDTFLRVSLLIGILGISVVVLVSLAKKFDKEAAEKRHFDGTVAVYNTNGDQIGSYDGNFDVSKNKNGFVIKDLETGKRVIINGATVVMQED